MRIRLHLPLLCCVIVVLSILGAPSFGIQSSLQIGPSSFAAENTARTQNKFGGAKGGKNLLDTFLSNFDLPAAAALADTRLKQNPRNIDALLVRMETAELEERTDLVLDAALRLCAAGPGPELEELASSRILQHAANTTLFKTIVPRLKAAAALNTGCAFNLRLALVAAAMDGQPQIDLDHAVHSAGLITHWRIAGPFGQYSNVDFERRWPAEIDQMARPQYTSASAGKKDKTEADAPSLAVERFYFRDGMLSLPDYFPSRGIFYAAGEIDTTYLQPSQLDVLSAGAYAVFIDGKPALLDDSRYSAGPARNSAVLHLRPGHHRVLVKFTPDAAPLSVALHPQFSFAGKSSGALAASAYIGALNAYFRGDFPAMDRMLQSESPSTSHSKSKPNPALAQYLRALLYSAVEEHSSVADAAWKSVAAAQPAALLARLKAAEGAEARGQSEEARQEVMSVLAASPDSESALQLAFGLVRGETEAPALLARLLDLHPSCSRLADAVKFSSSTAEQDRARELEQQMATCAPGSLQYARMLSESGRHSAAAAYLQQLVVKNPLDRAARRLLVRQLVLSGQQGAAQLQAKQLAEIAPNAPAYARLAREPESAQDSYSPRGGGFTDGREFYVPYRRDGRQMVAWTATRVFSGGPLVILLSDKVIEFQPEGQLAVYVHRILRPLTKDGISRYGEVALPRGADLLELRTIKPSGQVIEPELAQQKPTISMPALEPGDAIEEEYVVHYPGIDFAPESAASLTFASFDAPILYSRLVLLNPKKAKLIVREEAGPPQALVGSNGDSIVRIWERENMSQRLSEPSLPAANLLPAVTVAAAGKNRDRLRDQLIDSTRAGLRVNETLASLAFPRSAGELEKATRLYRYVTTKIESTGPDWAGSSAEEALQNGQGSRTSVLLALARAAGLKTGLLLARKLDRQCAADRDLSCYTEPLVRFWFSHGENVDVDAEADDLPFGALSPALFRREALSVPLTAEDERRPEIATLAESTADEKSVAEGELSFDKDDLVAELEIRLGATRAQEIRSLLRTASPADRQAFFEQLAIRIFPGAGTVTGSAAHEDDPEQPLHILLHCTVPQFLARRNGTTEIDQLVPALGLRSLYARTPSRKFPLYIDSLFLESTAFHLHLPAGVQVRSAPADFLEKGEFGEYSVRFTQSARQLDIRREFRIPAQVVAPEKYQAFALFARDIDEAEHQRISLQIEKDLSAFSGQQSAISKSSPGVAH
jgi:tetratricopeptide (TPR) repeat protein